MRTTALLLLAGLMASSAHAVDVSDLAGEEWYGLYMNGQKVGYIMVNLSVAEDETATLFEESTFKFNMGGLNQRMGLYSKRTYAPGGALQHIKYIIKDPSGSSEFDGVVSQGKLVLTTTIGDQITVENLPTPKETLEDMIKLSKLVMKKPAIGSEIETVLFEPMYKTEIHNTSRIIEKLHKPN